MQNLKMTESGKNWLRKAPVIFLTVCCGSIGLFCVISVILAFNSSNYDGDISLAVIGLALIALPLLPAIFKNPVTIEMISQDGQLVIEKNHGVELRTQWSDIKTVSAPSVMGAVVLLHFIYINSEGKKTKYHLNTKFLSKDDISSIALLVDENWTGKYGTPESLNV